MTKVSQFGISRVVGMVKKRVSSALVKYFWDIFQKLDSKENAHNF